MHFVEHGSLDPVLRILERMNSDCDFMNLIHEIRRTRAVISRRYLGEHTLPSQAHSYLGATGDSFIFAFPRYCSSSPVTALVYTHI
jgi:hypothetical protein